MKRGFCKFHNFLGHKTSQCVLFRGFVQKTLNDERLKFGEKTKPPMQVDADPLQVSKTLYAEQLACMMVEATEVTNVQVEEILKEEYAEKMKVVYPQAEEELIDFLNRCKLNNKEVMLCPRCSAVFDKEAAEGLRNYKPFASQKGKWQNQRPDKGKGVAPGLAIQQRLSRNNTFFPKTRVPVGHRVNGQRVTFNKRNMDRGSSSNPNQKSSNESNKYSYRNNYMDKNPMTMTQWRFQSQKKLAQQNAQNTAKGKDNKVYVEMAEGQ
jgi:hypothetical protein